MIKLPCLYAILDSANFQQTSQLLGFASELVDGGVTLLQYRNKSGDARAMLEQAEELKKVVGAKARLIMNDRADLCLAAGFNGVHVGQGDLSVEGARRVVGENVWVGVSTHNAGQLRKAAETSADYVAMGPIFSTTSKERPDPLVGLEGVREARALTSKPLVAIGGITRANCRSVIEAGVDAVAVISDLVTAPRKSAEEFFRILR